MRFQITLLILLFATVLSGTHAQDVKTERSINQSLLKVIKTDIEAKYLDTGSHVTNLESSYQEAYDLVARSSSRQEMARIVGLFLVGLNDPRIFFLPRNTNVDIDYQWTLDLIGDSVYVKDLITGSDAYAKGIRPGDRIYMLEGYILSKKNFWKIRTIYEIASPQESLNVIVVKPNGAKYKVEIKAKVTVSNTLEDFTLSQNRNRFIPDESNYEEKLKPKFNDDVTGLLICRFPSFLVELISLEKLLDKAKHNRALVLDLRGAGGIAAKAIELRIRLNRETGAYIVPEMGRHIIDRDDGDLETLKFMTAFLLHSRQRIGEIKRRKGSEKLTASASANEAFSGKIIVLVDGETSGAAEIFARLIQLEKRGIVLGDVTAGRSVKTTFLAHSSWVTFTSPFGLQLPVAEVVLTNGDQINEKGVTPDQIILPTQSDMAKQSDPVLASAARQLGFTLSPEDAGKIFEKKK